MLLRFLVPYLLPTYVLNFELHPKTEIKKCFTCSVFTFINSQLVCANPSTCEADYCYTYIVSDGRTIFLSGCAEDVSDFQIHGYDTRLKCHTRGPIALCVCSNTGNSCQDIYPPTRDTPVRRNLTHSLDWFDTDLTQINAISLRVAGFSSDYARNRIGQMRIEHFPDKLPGLPISHSPSIINYLSLLLVFIVLN